MNNTSVDSYLNDGCGRCELFATPQCKVHSWTDVLVALRALLNATPLVEEMKWGSPCYTLYGENVIMMASYKQCCFLSFLRGALLRDDDGVLEFVGPNTHAARLFKFTSVAQVQQHSVLIERFIAESIALHQAGTKVAPRESTDELPEELAAMLDANPDVAAAYRDLSPGRQRSYILHVGGAKQAKTRQARADRCTARILAGKGFNER